jgi:hypothetical protein
LARNHWVGPTARAVALSVNVQSVSSARRLAIDQNAKSHGAPSYQLIRQPKPITDRQFEIEFLDSGVEAFAFTFG